MSRKIEQKSQIFLELCKLLRIPLPNNVLESGSDPYENNNMIIIRQIARRIFDKLTEYVSQKCNEIGVWSLQNNYMIKSSPIQSILRSQLPPGGFLLDLLFYQISYKIE